MGHPRRPLESKPFSVLILLDSKAGLAKIGSTNSNQTNLPLAAFHSGRGGSESEPVSL